MIPFLLVLPLLVSLAQGNMPISGCSVPNSCFGLPSNCQPDTNCHVYFQFDQEGNLDVNVKDVTDEDEYIALTVDIQPGLSVDYLICLPRQSKRLRAFSVKGQPIQVSDEKMAQSVQEVSNNNFICTFFESELPPNFRQKSLFFVTEGIFTDDDQMIIPPGRQLSPINSDFVYMHKIAATSMNDDDEMVLTPDENKMTSDLVKKVQRISKSASKDLDLEDILNGSEEEEEQDDDLEDMLDSRKKYSTRKKDLQKKKKVASRRDEDDEDEDDEEEEERKPRRRNGRPSRYQKDDDDEEEDEDDEDFEPKKKSRRPSSRRFDSDEEDDEEEEEEDNHKGKSRKNKNHKKKGKKSDEDEYEDDEERQDDDESYDDERNSENAYPYTIPVIIVTLVYCFLIRN
ncbi:unnamed protein product [Caenorhabditis brenneri]